MSGEFANQDVLRVIGVLVLVDQNVAEAPPVVLGDLGMTLQHPDRLADQIVEVQGIGPTQPALVFGVDLGHHFGEVVAAGLQRGDRLLGSDQFVFQVGDRGGQQPRGVALDVDPHVAADHQQQPAGVVGVVDGEIGVQPGQQRGLVAQDPHAGGVERRHPHVAGSRTDQMGHPLAHLGGRFVGEGDGQDLTGPDVAGGEQVGDPPGEHRRLSRTRAGDDQQRCTRVQHRLPLLGVQTVEQVRRFTRRPEIHYLNTHDAPNLPLYADSPLRRRAREWQTL